MIVRPDGRCFIRADEVDEAPDGCVYATVDAADEAALQRLAAAGFVIARRENRYRIPTAVAAADPPAGIRLLRADAVPEDDLRALDDLLRQDVPGTDGWRWTPSAFHEETYETPAFDPETYLVAQDAASGDYVGIVRVWMRSDAPRLGFVGVRRAERGRGVARALVAAVFGVLAARGITEVSTEIDETNVASRRLLERDGARIVGRSFELRRTA